MTPVRNAKSSKPRRPAAPLFEACESRRLFSTYTVTTTADSGAGSLRDAIKAANKSSGLDTIKFAIGSGQKTIAPKTILPYVSSPVVIDGTSQPGYSGKPLIELRGDVSGGYGLSIGAGGSTVKALVINRYSSGLLFTKAGGNTVQGCYIGTGYSGTTKWGNKDKGIIVQSPGNKFIDNVISGNGTQGLQFYTGAASNNLVQGNKIGTDVTGTFAIPTGQSGIAVNGGANNLIGGTTAAARNVISGNGQDGIVINKGGASGNVIQGNFIGTDVTGTKRVANLNYGVETSQPKTVVGGDTAAARNVVSGNGFAGVVLWLASGSDNVVKNNYIGTDVTGTQDLGNHYRGLDISNGSSRNLVENNLISGNDEDGIMVYQGQDNTIKGNTIGLDVTKTKALPNLKNGIRFTNTTKAYASNNTIGYNGGYGLLRTGGGTIGLSGNVLISDAIFNL